MEFIEALINALISLTVSLSVIKKLTKKLTIKNRTLKILTVTALGTLVFESIGYLLTTLVVMRCGGVGTVCDFAYIVLLFWLPFHICIALTASYFWTKKGTELENFQPTSEQSIIKDSFTMVTPLSKYLAMILFIAMPFIGGWIGYTYAPEKVVEVEKITVVEKVVENEDDSAIEVTTQSDKATIDSEGLATATKTGYIVSISDTTIVIDYVDILFGEEALTAKISDGYCDTGATIDECFRTPPLSYDRNASKTLRTFKVSSEVSVFSESGTEITTDFIAKNNLAFKIPPSKYDVDRFSDSYHGPLFEFTMNSNDEVIKIKGIFRP